MKGRNGRKARLESMAEGCMTHIMQQRCCPHDSPLEKIAPGSSRFEKTIGHMLRSKRVPKTRMLSPRIDKTGQSKLADVTEALNRRRVDELKQHPLRWVTQVKMDDIVHGVSKEFLLLFGWHGSLRSAEDNQRVVALQHEKCQSIFAQAYCSFFRHGIMFGLRLGRSFSAIHALAMGI